jgi:hypothetical protein
MATAFVSALISALLFLCAMFFCLWRHAERTARYWMDDSQRWYRRLLTSQTQQTEMWEHLNAELHRLAEEVDRDREDADWWKDDEPHLPGGGAGGKE